MSEVEVKERLARIETLLDGIAKRLDGDERHRDACYKRFDSLEEYIDIQKGANAANEKFLGKVVSIITIINIITLLSLKVLFHA